MFGRIFISRLLVVLGKLKLQHHKFRVNQEVSKDLMWWKRFLLHFNGVTFIPDVLWSEPDGVFSTDACLSGGGGWYNKQFFRFKFPQWVLGQDFHINILELMVVVIAVKIWGQDFSSKRIQIYCDNTATVATVNSGRTRDKHMLGLLRELAFHCAKVNCVVKAVHLPGCDNRLADLLSRSPSVHRTKLGSMVGPDWKEVFITEEYVISYF